MKKIPLSFPCGQRFDQMKPRTAMSRLCGECDTLVHDLSSMSEMAARALLEETKGNVCIRYLYDETGKVQFRDQLEALPAAPVPASWLNRQKRSIAAAACVVSVPIFTEACGAAMPSDSYGNDAGIDEASDAGFVKVVPSGDAASDAGAMTDAGSDAEPDAAADAGHD